MATLSMHTFGGKHVALLSEKIGNIFLSIADTKETASSLYKIVGPQLIF